MITLEPSPSLTKIICLTNKEQTNLFKDYVFLNSGKSSFSTLIEYFISSGLLRDKNSSVFMPKWIGSPVYQEIAGRSIPSGVNNSNHDVYVMYHQYGFPQNINAYLSEIKSQNPIIIEDCAHRIEGPLINKNLNLQSYSIYSFTKFTFSFLLGGIYTTDDNFRIWYSKWVLNKKHSILMNLFKIIDEYYIRTNNFQKIDYLSTFRKMYFSVFSDYSLPLESSISIFKKNIEIELNRRKEIYKYLTCELSKFDILPNNFEEVKYPYAIPLKLEMDKITKSILKLEKIKIRAYNYNFDYAFNNLNPSFKKSLVIPCHSELSDLQVELMSKNIIKIIT